MTAPEDPRTHWILVWHFTDGTALHASTRAEGQDTMTEAEVRQALLSVLQEEGPDGMLWVRDYRLEDGASLVFLAQVVRVALERDISPGEEEAQRHLELVLTEKEDPAAGDSPPAWAVERWIDRQDSGPGTATFRSQDQDYQPQPRYRAIRDWPQA